jgi:WD40 repeat protein
MNALSFHRILSLSVLLIGISARIPFALAQNAEAKPQETPLLPVFGIDISPDGKLLAASAGRSTMNGYVAVWSVADRKLQFDRNESQGVRHVTFSPHGTSLAYVTGEVVAILDTKTWVNNHRWNAEQTGVHCVAYSPDGQWLATGATDGTVKIWKTKTAEEVKSIAAHKEEVYSVAFSPDGMRLLSGGGDGKAILWNCEAWQAEQTFQPSRLIVRRIRWSNDGLFFLTSRWDGNVRIRDAYSGALLAFTRGGSDSADLSQDNRLLVTTGSRNEAHIHQVNLDPPTPDQVKQIRDLVARFADDDYHAREAAQKEIAKLGMVAVPVLREYAGDSDAEVRIRTRILRRELMAPEPLAKLTGHRGDVEVVRLSPDGERIATGCRGGDIKLWDAKTFQELATFQSPAIKPNEMP